MTQVRITLEEPNVGADQGVDVMLRYGTEVIVPMNFGGYSDESSVNFRETPQALPAQPREWILSWNDPDRRAALVPIEVAMYYFGDWRSDNDGPAVRAGRVRKLNVERDRVATVWGDYHFSTKNGLYSTVKIAVPKVPHVVVQNVNENGATVGDFAFRPWEFFKWQDYLDPNATAEYRAELDDRRNKSKSNSGIIDIVSQLTPEQIDQIASLVNKSSKAQKAAHA